MIDIAAKRALGKTGLRAMPFGFGTVFARLVGSIAAPPTRRDSTFRAGHPLELWRELKTERLLHPDAPVK